MTQFRRDETPQPRFARTLALKRLLARTVLIAEQFLPRTLVPGSIVLLFLAVTWLGFFRSAPFWLHAATLFAFVVGFVASLIPLTRIRLPSNADADRMLEERNALPHQAIRVQHDRPATESPLGDALWREHQARMARMIGALDTGLPRPDIARHDPFALRAVPVLLACVAFAYSYSNRAGLLSDAFRLPRASVETANIRVDAWVTPPPYTGRAPIFLTGKPETAPVAEDAGAITIPQFSDLTVRVTGAGPDEMVRYAQTDGGKPITIPAAGEKAKETQAAPTIGEPGPKIAEMAAPETMRNPDAVRNHVYKIVKDGELIVGDRRWTFKITPDGVPQIAFDGIPHPTINGALEITFKASDDYGIAQAWADIKPLDDAAEGARPLFPLPEYRLDLPRRNAREAKGTTSRNLSEHPLAGKRIQITLVARDVAGQEGRSPPYEMILPARQFSQPLAVAVAEQR